MAATARFSSSTRIRAPIEFVFEYFADRTRYPRVQSMMSLQQQPPGPVGLGTVFTLHYHRRGIDVLWIVDEFEPPTRVRFRIEWPGEQPMFEAYSLAADGDATRLRHESGSLASELPFRKRLSFAALRPIYAVIGPLGLLDMRRRVERDLRARGAPGR